MQWIEELAVSFSVVHHIPERCYLIEMAPAYFQLASHHLLQMSQEVPMNTKAKHGSAPAFVVLHQMSNGQWKMLGEVPRKRGLTARAARSQAILHATKGAAQAGEVYAAILRSEWRIAMDWMPPKEE
jgi:hypothetical protein